MAPGKKKEEKHILYLCRTKLSDIYICRYPYAQNPRVGTGRLVRVLAFLTEDDTGTVLYSAVPILAKCHYWNIRDSSVCIGMTIRVLAFLTEDDTGTGLFDRGRYGYWPF